MKREGLVCGICGQEVVVIHSDEHGTFPSHADGADHAPDVECLGNAIEAAEFLGIERDDFWVAPGLIALKPINKPDAPWVIFRG